MKREEKLLEIATSLLASMPSNLAATLSDTQAAEWALNRAAALIDAFAQVTR